MNNKAELKNDVFIKASDYEKYQLVLPYRFLFGRKKQRFIYSELEKMHPCFSDEFCFDSNIKGLSKKGAVSEVSVIHKYTLAEYEAKRSFSGSLINKITGSGFLTESSNRHRVFIDKKMKTLLSGCFVIFSFIMFFFIFGCVSKIENINGKTKNNHPNTSVLASDKEEVSQTISDISEMPTDSPGLCEKFFSEIKAADGKILSFKWKLEGFEEVVEAKVKGVFPEQFTCVNMSAVNYEKELPVIQISGVQKTAVIMKNHSVVEKQDFYKKLREMLVQNSAVIKEERLNPYNICFSCQKDLMQNVFTALETCFKDFEKKLSFFEIREMNENLFEITAGELKAELEVRDSILSFEMLAKNVELFGDKKKKTVPAKRSMEKKSEEKIELVEKSGALKIGEIKNSDGKIISFYKNSDGKLLKVLEEKKR